MEIIGDIFRFAGYGLGGLFVILVVITLIFGKRVIKKWEYEANIYSDKRREIGEFDIEMKKYDVEGAEFELKAKFVLRHPELTPGKVVKIFLNDELVMEGPVTDKGRIYLRNEHLISTIDDPQADQICRVMCSSVELFSEPLKAD